MNDQKAGAPHNAMFDYDDGFATDWGGRRGPARTAFIANLALKMLPGWLRAEIVGRQLSIHDHGCAEGDGLPVWARAFPACAVSGSDVSETALAEARRRYPTLTFLSADGGRVPVTADVMFTSTTLERLPDWRGNLAELAVRARRHVMVLAAFDEKARLQPDHTDFGMLPVSLPGDFRLAHHAISGTIRRAGSRWSGKHVLAVWCQPDAIDASEMAGQPPLGGVDDMDLRHVPLGAIPVCLQLAYRTHHSLNQLQSEFAASVERARAELQLMRRQANDEIAGLRYQISEYQDEVSSKGQGLGDRLDAMEASIAQARSEVQDSNLELTRRAAEISRLEAAIDQYNQALVLRERDLQANFDGLRQQYSTITSMNSFRYMMWALEQYGRARGVRISRPRTPERLRVRLDRLEITRRPSATVVARATEQCLLPTGAQASPPAKVAEKRSDACLLVQVGSLNRGGVEQVIYDQAQGFEALGKRVVVLVTGAGGDIANRLMRSGTEVVILGGYEPQAYADAVDRLSIEAAITHYSYEGLRHLRQRGFPIVEVVHNYYHWCQHDIAAFRSAAAPATRRVAVSTGVADFHAEVFGYERSAFEVIVNPINREGLIRPERQLLEASRRARGGPFTFINVAQFYPAKAQIMLVAAFAAVHRNFPRTRLVLLGSFSDQKVHAAIVEHVKELGLEACIEMPGFVDRRRLSRYLCQSHVFVQPSVYEGYSVAMTEAAHFALPLILTRIGGALDVVENSDCGILIPPHAETLNGMSENEVYGLGLRRAPPNLTALIEAMRQMIVDYDGWSERGYIGQARIDRNTIEAFARKYLAVVSNRLVS